MKKICLLLVAVFALGFAANAQDAIGLRFGGGTKYGAEISYQKSLAANRLEFDLGVNLPDFDFFYLTGVYQWKGEITDWLGWYAGPGAKVSFCKNHGVGVAVAGQLGLEAEQRSAVDSFLRERQVHLLGVRPCGGIARGIGEARAEGGAHRFAVEVLRRPAGV